MWRRAAWALLCIARCAAFGRDVRLTEANVTKVFANAARNRNPMKKFNGGLSSREQFAVEAWFLRRLQRTPAPPNCSRRHFPLLLAVDVEKAALTTSRDGAPLAASRRRRARAARSGCPRAYRARDCDLHDCAASTVKNHGCFAPAVCRVAAADLCAQLTCVGATLLRANVQHGDVHGGRNLALDDRGRLTLFDFDMARFDGARGPALAATVLGAAFRARGRKSVGAPGGIGRARAERRDAHHLFGAMRSVTADCHLVDGADASHRADRGFRCHDAAPAAGWLGFAAAVRALAAAPDG